MNLIKNIRHVGIVVSDIKKSLNLFINILGFKIHNNLIEDGKFISEILKKKNCKVNTVKIVAPDGNKIELLNFYKSKKKKQKINIDTLGITHISMTVKSVDKICKVLKKEKIVFLSRPKVSNDKKVKVVFCKLFANCFLELVEVLN
jgi:hypothetical protein